MTTLTTTDITTTESDTIAQQKAELFYLLLDLGSLAKAVFNHPQFQQVLITVQQFAEEDSFGVVVYPIEPNAIAALESRFLSQAELEAYLSTGVVEGDWNFVSV